MAVAGAFNACHRVSAHKVEAGSLAKAVRRYTDCTLYGYDACGAVLSRALDEGVVSAALTPDRLAECELVIIPIPSAVPSPCGNPGPAAHDGAHWPSAGARNMQNFELLKELGKLRKPVLIKRGMANTLQELLMSAEYVMAGGNEQVILCERGIRTFETATRNTMDLSVIPVLHGPSAAAGCPPRGGPGRRRGRCGA